VPEGQWPLEVQGSGRLQRRSRNGFAPFSLDLPRGDTRRQRVIMIFRIVLLRGKVQFAFFSHADHLHGLCISRIWIAIYLLVHGFAVW